MPKPNLAVMVIFNSLVLFLPLAAVVLWRRPRMWSYLLALFLGIVVGWLDLNSSEPSATALLLLTLGMFLGFAHARHAWLLALILGMWVPVGALADYALGLRAITPTELVTSPLALIFALAGTYAGVLLFRASDHLTEGVSPAEH